MEIALVQGNIEQAHKWDPAYQREVFDTYRAMTLEAAKKRPDLIIWPETATPFFWQDEELRAQLVDTVKDAGTWLMTGSPSVEKSPDDRVVDYNSAYLLSPDGRETGRYDKMHLVPFGEYVPLKRLLPFVSKMVTAIGDFGTGEQYTVLKTDKGSFGTAICFEVIFPELVRQFALNGANFLTSITNDAWFGVSAAPYQHFNMAVFRAVENRRALARAANTGITGIILPTGAVQARTGIFERTTLEGRIPLMGELTFYTRHGDVFAYICVVISVLIIALNMTGGRRHSERSEESE
jgi:apolipoprotein N-acyltransferase